MSSKTKEEEIFEAFLIPLEYYLGNRLSTMEVAKAHGLWCDGVLMPYVDNQLNTKTINKYRQLVIRTWIGSGLREQHAYTLTLKFGNKALSRYIRGLSLKECLPSEELSDTLILDIAKKEITLHLL